MPALSYANQATSQTALLNSAISSGFNGGRVMNGGNISGTNFTSLGLGLTQQKGGGPTVKNTNVTDPIYSGNTFGRAAGQIIAKATTSIGGNGDLTIQKMGDDLSRANHPQVRVGYSFLSQRSWNQQTQESLAYTDTYRNTDILPHGISEGTNTAGADQSTRSPRSNGPEITITDGSRYPVNKSLPVKKNG